MILQERCGKVTGSHRKAPEIAGSGSSIPTGNLLDFFPVDSDQFPVLSSRNRSEIIGKNPKIFRLEYCFHVPVTSGAFLPEPARIFRPGITLSISSKILIVEPWTLRKVSVQALDFRFRWIEPSEKSYVIISFFLTIEEKVVFFLKKSIKCHSERDDNFFSRCQWMQKN